MTGTSDQIRAVFLSVLMVVSVFGGVVALSGSAAADVSSVSNASADDVVAADGVQQNVSFNVTTNGTDEVVNVSFGAGNIQSVSVLSVNNGSGAEVTAANASVVNATEASVDVNGTGSGQTATVTLQVTHDLSGVDSASGVSVDIADDSGNDSVSTSFDIAAFDKDVSGTASQLVFQGETVLGTGFSGGETVTLRRNTSDGGSEFVDQDTTTADGNATFNTSNLESANYFMTDSDGNVVPNNFEVAVQDFSASADDGEVD
ncbi:MAG: surface glycoprotein, partial [Halolamina sp.]